jgi:hypothetical protein
MSRSLVMPNGERPPGPGPAKIRVPPLFQRRRLELFTASAGRLQALFDEADVVSEGAMRDEGSALVYYGTTSLLVALPLDESVPAQLDRTLALDPHLRVRAVRVAHREASARAGAPLGMLHAEVHCGLKRGATTATFALTVDVTARVLRASARPSRA